MKYFVLLISLLYLSIAAKAQETTNTQLPPVRTTDNAQPQLSKAAPAIPVLAAGNASTPRTAPSVQAVPVLAQGGASAAKAPASVQAVPVRKSDLAAPTSQAPAATNSNESSPATKALPQPPSSISIKQAMEQQQKQDGNTVKPAQ